MGLVSLGELITGSNLIALLRAAGGEQTGYGIARMRVMI
jgi:hypothetical protein